MLQDTTSGRVVEKKLAQLAEDVSAKNRELQRFTSIISHDLRAPLVNIAGFICELKYSLALIRKHTLPLMDHLAPDERSEMEKALDRDVPEAMAFIDSSVGCMDQKIHALLTLSRLQRQSLDLIQVETSEIVQACLEMQAHQIQEQGIQVIIGDIPAIKADQIAVTKIFTHLLDNAVKYISPNRTGTIEINGKREADHTLFWIQDNGRGIDVSDYDKIFGVFQRAGMQEVEGDGMGLAYVYTLVDKHGGRIWCESILDEGACFYFTFADEIDGL